MKSLNRDQLSTMSAWQVAEFFEEQTVADTKEWLESQKAQLEKLENMLEDARALTPREFLGKLDDLADRIKERLDGTYASLARQARGQ